MPVQHGFKKLSSNLGYLLQEIPAWFTQSRIRCHEYKGKFMAELNALQKNDGNSENTLLAVKQCCLEMLMGRISQVEMHLIREM